MSLELSSVSVPLPEGLNVILGQSHFIKTVEDLYEILITSSTSIRFGLAFCEASGDRLIRKDGNDDDLIRLAVSAAQAIGCGHMFVIYLKESWPINVLNQIKNCQEVCQIYAATANPISVVVASEGEARGVMGVLDGLAPLGVESQEDALARRNFLRSIVGYKR